MMADTIFEAGLWPTFCILTKTRFSRFFYFVADSARALRRRRCADGVETSVSFQNATGP
jgi:hypothetical protein